MSDTSTIFTHETKGLPDALRAKTPLWESVRRGGGPSPTLTQTRLYDDGRLYSWSATRRVMDGGKPTRQPAPAAWRLDAKVSADGLHAVKDHLAAFAAVPADAPPDTSADRGQVAWRAHVGAKAHTVTRPASAADAVPSAIRAIETAIQGHIVPESVPWAQPE